MDFFFTQYCRNYRLDIVCDGSVVIGLYMHFAADGFATLIDYLMCVFSSDGIVVEFVITSSEVMDKRALVEDMP